MDEGQLLVANLFDFAACQITLRLAGDWSVDSLANSLSIRLSDLLIASWRFVYRLLSLSVGEQSVISPLILLTISLLIPMAIPVVACLVIGAAFGLSISEGPVV